MNKSLNRPEGIVIILKRNTIIKIAVAAALLAVGLHELLPTSKTHSGFQQAYLNTGTILDVSDKFDKSRYDNALVSSVIGVDFLNKVQGNDGTFVLKENKYLLSMFGAEGELVKLSPNYRYYGFFGGKPKKGDIIITSDDRQTAVKANIVDKIIYYKTFAKFMEKARDIQMRQRHPEFDMKSVMARILTPSKEA